MPNFNRGDTLSFTLDYDDQIQFIGKGKATITPNGGSAYETQLTGTQTIGPFNNSVSVSILCDTAGSYTISNQPYAQGPLYPLYDAGGGLIGVANNRGLIGALSTKQWRGIGQGMSICPTTLASGGFAGGTNIWSKTHRTRHYTNVRFKRVRAVIACFSLPSSGTITDTLFTQDYNFQVGFEQNFSNSLTGLAPRKMFTWGGGTIAQYLSASPPSTGYLISDVLELDSYVEAFNGSNFFGLWTTVEAAARTGSNLIPYSRLASNFNNRYIGVIQAANTSQIDADSAQSATSITASTSSQSGATEYFAPQMLLIETDSGQAFIVGVGDSITYGVGEGVTGSGAYGDATGSPLSNSGWLERAVHENLGLNMVNLSKGSDGNKYLITASNWQYRKQLLTLANPTHVVNSNVHNDITATITINARVISTAYNKYDVINSSSQLYTNIIAGTSSASASISATTSAVTDGTAWWQYLGAVPAPTTARGAAQIYAWMANVNAQIKTAVPSAKIVGMLPTPDAASTDSWATSANQTANTGYGDSTQRRGTMYGYMQTYAKTLGFSSLINPNTAVEDANSPNTNSKWYSNGTASLVTNDGTHPNSYGHYLMSNTVPSSAFV